jgi:hypothetical protein
MGDAQSLEGALELTPGIPVVAARTGAEEAQRVRVDGLGHAAGLEGFAEVTEVVPGGVGRDEATSDIESGMVIDGEQKDLLGRSRPPLMNGTVVLPEFPDPGAPESSIAARFPESGWDQIGEVSLAVRRDRRTGALECAQAQEFVADELEVGRVHAREEDFQKGVDVSGPASALIAAAGHRAKFTAVFQPGRSKLVEAGSPHTELSGGGESVQQTRIEFFESAADKLGWETMAELFLFKSR